MRRDLAHLLAASVALCGAVAAQKDARSPREALVEQLGAADPAVRSQAYNTLIRDRDPEVVALVGKRIESMPAEGQQFALYVLQQHPLETTRALYTKLLGAERALLCAHAAAALVRAGDRARLPVLVKAVAAAPAKDRQLVLNTLWAIADPTLAEAVRGYVAADQPAHLVVSALEHLRRLEATPNAATDAAVQRLLGASAADVRAAGLAFLVGGPDGARHAAELAKLLTEPRHFWLCERLLPRDRSYPAVLGEAFAAALAAPRSQHDVNQLVPLIKATAPDRLAATLRTLLTHANVDVRSAAISALATVPGGLQQKELLQLLQGGTPEQQLAVATVLRRMDDASGLPTVLALARAAGPLRAKALEALGGFRTREVVPALLDALDAPEPAARQHAWTALQGVLRDLFPYRRFDFARSGYDPNAADRSPGLAALRAWWATVP